MDYREMINYHNRQDADLTVAFVNVTKDEAHRFGVGEIEEGDEEGGRLLSYEEKPAEPKSAWASLTILCFKPEVLYAMLKENQQHDSYEFGRDIIPMMMRKNYRVFGFKFRGYWGYTKTVNEYWQTSMDLLGPEPKIDPESWGIRTNLEHRDIRGCQPLLVGPDGELDNALAYNGCTVNGSVQNSILFPGVVVEKGATVRDSVLFFNNIVKQGAALTRIVSDVNTVFEQNCRVGGRPSPDSDYGITVVGWNNRVPEGLAIGRGCTVSPRLAEEAWPRENVIDGEVL
jgi:glucose-1-phosphate adenylyltransferase